MTHGTIVRLCAASMMAGTLLVSAQERLPSEPFRQFGNSVTGAFEGWFDNPDGSHSFLLGYLNRNTAEELDVPIGPNNRIEPGGPDRGQPTHFLTGRQHGMFIVTVPKSFTAQDKLTWTLVANGQPTSIPLRMHPDYIVSPFTDVAVGNTPPVLRFDERGPTIQGPLAKVESAPARTATAGAPLGLTVWPSDDGKFASPTMAIPKKLPPPIELFWSKYRGPGAVKFEPAAPALEILSGGAVNAPVSGKATTTATFGAPGEYVLHVRVLDYSGLGTSGEVCCWTTAVMKVTVTP
ncbi:MAG: hypothetical protein U0Q12_01895 [Vicinamibacterales bacterium]